ncbi:Polysaccharide pyruvyl transferase [Ruminococcaceae bacterium YRB3002]|nr:Polysaccharide pyruvyl transferase [Ruminococcaceae bacterium YRB3002]
MRIGIVTYWKSSVNYGEQLQNYALQEYLRGLGHDPFLIRYDYENDTIYGSRPVYIRIIRALNPGRLINYFTTRKNNRKRINDCIKHPRGFEEFRERYLSMSRVYTTIDDLRNDPPEADIYITGSDQVWNTFEGGLIEMKNRIRAFFLDFGHEDTLRISYAASWGRTWIPDDEVIFIKPLISRFNAITVRERSGIDICHKMGREDACLSSDPVLLHDAETYRKLYRENGEKIQNEKYLLFYYMNNDGKYNRRAVFDWASSMGLKTIYITDDWHDDLTRSFPGITEWLELIDKAEFVVTNSYHCALFALIFEKRIGVIRRFGKYTGMNTRMDHLFESCGIKPRYIDDDGFRILERPADKINLKAPDESLSPEEVIARAVDRSKN